MYDTKDFKSKKEKEAEKNVIHITKKQPTEKFNPFMTGHGPEGGDKNTRRKRDKKRKKAETRKIVSDFYSGK